MASIPLPALGLQPPQPPANPVDQYGKMLTLRNMLQQQQLGQVDLQQRQQELLDQKAMTDAWGKWDGKSYDSLIPLAKDAGASARALIALKQHSLDMQSKISEISKNDALSGSTNTENMLKTHDVITGKLTNLLSLPDEQLHGGFQQALKDLATPERPGQAALLDPQHAQSASQMLTLDAPALRQRLDFMRKEYLSNTQLLTEAKDAADLAAKKAQLPGQVAESQQKQTAVVAPGSPPRSIRKVTRRSSPSSTLTPRRSFQKSLTA